MYDIVVFWVMMSCSLEARDQDFRDDRCSNAYSSENTGTNLPDYMTSYPRKIFITLTTSDIFIHFFQCVIYS